MNNEVKEFIPHPGQKKIFTSKKRFIFAMGGNRGGKTTAGCYFTYMGAQVPETNHLIAANTYDQLVQSTLSKFFEEFPSLKKYYIKRDKLILLPNGSKIFCRSLDDPDMIKGMNLHSIWVDEGDGLTKYAWTVIRSRVATTNGKILITSSIYPRSWIYDLIFKDGEDREDYELITWESRENPSFSQKEWETLKAETDPITFAREYESKFAFASGRVYDEILNYGVLDKLPEDVKFYRFVFGLDYGINDPTALIVLGYATNGCWYIIDEWYNQKVSIQDINAAGKMFVERYGRPFYTCQDPAGGVARLSLLPEMNPVDAVKKIYERVSLIRNLIYQKRVFVLKKCVNTIKEFEHYSFQEGKPNEPEDSWNHAMDAIGYAIHTTHAMLEPAAVPKEEREVLNSFWQRKAEQGLYKDGQLVNNNIEGDYDDFIDYL